MFILHGGSDFCPRPLSQRRDTSLKTIILSVLAVTVGLAIAGCGAPAADQDNPAIQVILDPAPNGPAGNFLDVTLKDAAGTLLTDATVRLEGNMNHAGMAPVITDAVVDEVDGAVDGVYRVPFQFTMMGDWIVTVSVERDGKTVQTDVDVSVTGDTVTVK